jgi:hypothetical protein
VVVVPAGAVTVDHDLWDVADRIGAPEVPAGARETDGTGAGVVTVVGEEVVEGLVPAVVGGRGRSRARPRGCCHDERQDDARCHQHPGADAS